MKEDKDNVVKIIRSLLLSARHGLTVNELCAEYTAMTCKLLPYKDLGYFSAVDMVKDMPGVIRPVFISGGVMLLKGIADDSTAHINALVKRQRSLGYNTKLVTPQQTSLKRGAREIIPNFIRANIKDLIEMYPKGLEINLFSNAYVHKFGKKLDPQQIGLPSVKSIFSACPDLISVKTRHGYTSVYPTQQSSDAASTNTTVHPGCRNGIPSDIKKEIYAVLCKQQNGVLSGRFLFEYKAYHNKELNIHGLGFNSVVELVSKIPDLVNISRPTDNGDWTLSAKQKQCGTKKDVVHQLPQYSLDSLDQLDGFVEMYLSYIIDPTLFWFQCACYTVELHMLMEEMNLFYCSESPASYNMLFDNVHPGQACCALFEDGKWYRAVIKNIVTSEIVQVFYVDYGNEINVNILSLRILKKEFMTLPCQAMKASLAGIKPQNNTWTKSAIERFVNLTNDQYLFGVIMEKEPTISLELINTYSDEDLHIAQVLIEEGFALSCIDGTNLNSPAASVKSTTDNHVDHFQHSPDVSSLQNFYQEYYNALQQVSLITNESKLNLAEKSKENKPIIRESLILTHKNKLTANTFGGSSCLEKHLTEVKAAPVKTETDGKIPVKSVSIGEDLSLYLFPYHNEPYITSTDISKLFWDGDILRQMLRQKGLQLPKEILLYDDHEVLFSTLSRLNISGLFNNDGTVRSCITVYHLQSLPEIFSKFKSKFANCCKMIENEIHIWKMARHGYWKKEVSKTEEEEELCLKLQALKFKRRRLHLTMMTNSASKSTMDEIKLIENEIVCIKSASAIKL